MQIKKFEAQNVPEALKLIKKEFGADAVILSVKKIEQGKRMLGLSRAKGVEVTAATDEKMEKINIGTSKYGYSKYKELQYDQAEDNFIVKKSFIGSYREGKKRFNKKQGYPRTQFPVNNKYIKELYAVFSQMLNQDVDETIAIELSRDASEFFLKNSFIYNNGFKKCFIQILNQEGISASRVKINKNNQKIIGLIGSTGVGKTTTIAKLAAAAKTSEKSRSVALITLDDNRIGAIEQIKVYSKIIGIPFMAASCKKELKKYIESLSGYDLIFIDTPGISQTNKSQINELNEVFHKISDIEFHLVLNAATNDKALKDILKKYSVFQIKRLLFTKLDESITYGSILNQLYRSKIPVSYFTNGQQIPEDIQAATIEKLIDLIFTNGHDKKSLNGSPEELAQRIIEFEQKIKLSDREYEKPFHEKNFLNLSEYVARPSALG